MFSLLFISDKGDTNKILPVTLSDVPELNETSAVGNIFPKVLFK